MNIFTLEPSKTSPRWNKVVSITSGPLICIIRLEKDQLYTLVSFFTQTASGLRIMVGLENKGLYFFEASKGFLHPDCVSLRLNLPQEEANVLTDWINVQIEQKAHEFGNYTYLGDK